MSQIPAWIMVALLLSAFGFQQTLSFVVQKQQHARRSVLAASGTATPPSSKTTDPIISPRVWDFQGHECYAEVAQQKSDASSFWAKAKPEIILIHGFGCSTVYWRETTKYLTQAGYTVHSLDLLGQGKSAKPGRAQGVEISIDLWAQMVDDYAQKFIKKSNNPGGVVLMGNSLGSVVALTAATSGGYGSDRESSLAYIPSDVQGICLYNCAVGLNSRNLLKDPSLNPAQIAIFTLLFDLLDALVFDNISLLTYLLDKVVTKELLSNALVGLYACAPDPNARVDDVLVDSFYFPAKDEGSVEALNQIYTNDAGKTPMEIHEEYRTVLQEIPLHLVWGSKDNVTPLSGSVGQFYSGLAQDADNKVSMNVIESGHIPFDEIPESNESVVQWMQEVVAKKQPTQITQGIFQWPFFS